MKQLAQLRDNYHRYKEISMVMRQLPDMEKLV